MTKNAFNYSCGQIIARISIEFFYPIQAKTEDDDNNKNKITEKDQQPSMQHTRI